MIYFDNAATSYPKPAGVVEAVIKALHIAGNPGRSSHKSARFAAMNMELARLQISQFLGVSKPQRIIFQPGATQAANLLLNGLLKRGDRVCVSSVEHNAITRPLSRLARQGVLIKKIPCLSSGLIDVDAAKELVREEPTNMLVCQHGSNVAGCIQPIEELAQIAHENNARIIVDGAQVAGHVPLSLDQLEVDAWFCSGHKGLPGPQGVGLLYKCDDFFPAALIAGGTGSGNAVWDENCNSDPECFEAGTSPFPLIMGLAAATAWLSNRNATEDSRANGSLADENVEQRTYKHEQDLTEYLISGISEIPGVTILGPAPSIARLPLVSFVSEYLAPDTIAHRLDADYEIAVRAGLHCAPDAHETLGTLTTGAVRISLNYANTLDEIDSVLFAVKKILSHPRA